MGGKISPAMGLLYQQKHRLKKRAEGLCAENGCRNETERYRCAPCRRLHTDQELQRQANRGKGKLRQGFR